MGEEQFEKLGEKKDEKEELAIERKREYTDLGLDLNEREEQVACHALIFALAITKKARREADT